MTIAQAQAPDKEELREVIAEVLDVAPEAVTDEGSFTEELGVDSLMALEVVVVLEKRYGCRFDERELRQVTCLQNCYDALLGKLRSA